MDYLWYYYLGGNNKERCPSGLRGSPGKRVCGKLHRGFKSLSLRHMKKPATRESGRLFLFAQILVYREEHASAIICMDVSGWEKAGSVL